MNQPLPYSERSPALDRLTCEIAVVGSGPGGSITACLLAEAGRNVVLIEEGADLPLESCPPFSLLEMEQKYRNGGITVAMGAPKVQYVEGRCVGGGSEVNSGLYYRTPSDVLEQWRHDFAVDGLEEAALHPHFVACEQAVNVCYLPGRPPSASLKLHEGALKLGWASAEVPRWFRYEDSTDADMPQGVKQSMSKTFVPRALASGCQLLSRTRVESLRQEGQRWSLKCRQQTADGLSRPVWLDAETVFVAGGAIQTPALLRRSGITHNIGNSLRLHPTIKVTAEFPDPINSATMGVPVHQVKQFAPRFSFGCSISSLPYLALAMADHPDYGNRIQQTWQNMAIYYAMITGSGRGSVRCIPGFRDPLVRYRLTPEDLNDVSAALHNLCLLLFEAGAIALYPSLTNGLRFTSKADLAQLPEQLPRSLPHLMTIHLFSSCPMGENRAVCATNSFGRVHGFQNLYVADASLLCTAPGVNPQGSIMAIARRNVLQFLGQL